MEKRIHSVAGREVSGSEHAVRAVLTLTGFSAVLGQIVRMRELIVFFSGNEVSLGIMLAAWLFWTAIGSILYSTLALGESRVRQVVDRKSTRLNSSHLG